MFLQLYKWLVELIRKLPLVSYETNGRYLLALSV
jgi:hypothetical protein